MGWPAISIAILVIAVSALGYKATKDKDGDMINVSYVKDFTMSEYDRIPNDIFKPRQWVDTPNMANVFNMSGLDGEFKVQIEPANFYQSANILISGQNINETVI